MEAQPDNNVLLAILAYIGPLVILSYLLNKSDAFVKFHVKQGLVLFIIEVVLWFFGIFVWILWPIIWIVNIGILVEVIIGIANAAQKKEKELPLVGSWAKNFKF